MTGNLLLPHGSEYLGLALLRGAGGALFGLVAMIALAMRRSSARVFGCIALIAGAVVVAVGIIDGALADYAVAAAPAIAMGALAVSVAPANRPDHLAEWRQKRVVRGHPRVGPRVTPRSTDERGRADPDTSRRR